MPGAVGPAIRLVLRMRITIAFLLCAIATAGAQAFTFAALGDMPYSQDEAAFMANQLGPQLRQAQPQFLIHYGDMKPGKQTCKTANIQQSYVRTLALLPTKVIYSPGDNDWTDCDREAAGSFNELKRLSLLRKLIADTPIPAGIGWQVKRQHPHYPENSSWTLGDVSFLTVHVVGSSNGRRQILNPKLRGADLAAYQKQARREVLERDNANLAWIESNFRARTKRTRAFVITMHTDPHDVKKKDRGRPPCDDKKAKKCHPYAKLTAALKVHAQAAKVAVLLIHGSTKEFCFDRPKLESKSPNLWHLNGPGDGITDAAMIRVNESDSNDAFVITRLMAPGEKIPACKRRL